MAINVNTVYTTVLSILNKEQRGYLTPYEFNKAATQVQLDIFEKYFTDLDAQLRISQNNFNYVNTETNLDDDISIFKCFGSCDYVTQDGYFSLPEEDDLSGFDIVFDDQPQSGEYAFYRLGTVVYDSVDYKEAQRLQRNDFYNIDRSDLTAPSENFPVYLYENNQIRVKPTTINTEVYASFIRKPKDVRWGYTVNSSNGAFVYDSTPFDSSNLPTTEGSTDFEISSNNQTEVILEILKYAGVVIRDPQIVQAAAQELAQK